MTAGFDGRPGAIHSPSMRFSKIPARVWIVVLIAAALLLGSSPFWLLAVGCAMPGSNC